RYEEVFGQSEAVIEKAQKAPDINNPRTYRVRLRELLVVHPLLEGTQFRKDIAARLEKWEKATGQQLNDYMKAREQEFLTLEPSIRALLLAQSKVEGAGGKLPAAQQAQLAALKQRQGQLDAEMSVPLFEQALRRFEQANWTKIKPIPPRTKPDPAEVA